MKYNNISKENTYPLIGNENIKTFLDKSIFNGKLAHSYIFLGPKDLGKKTTAHFFAKSLLCRSRVENKACGKCLSCKKFQSTGDEQENDLGSVHGDFHVIKKEDEKKNISIEQIREFIRILGMSSFAGAYKIGIIEEADTLSEGASNALLKTLEEPREKVMIILIASTLESIPETIASRSQVLNFNLVESSVIQDYLAEKHEVGRSSAKNIARLSMGRPALAMKFLEDKDFYQEYLEQANAFLDFFEEDINTRFAKLNELVGLRASGQESVKKILNIISIWQALFRDLLLVNTNNSDLLQHEIMADKVQRVAKSINNDRLLKINKILETNKKYIKANVNPKLALENIACNM